MAIDSELKREVVRLAKDQERIRLAMEIMESMESMVFYRGGDHSPRMTVINTLATMANACYSELELVDTWKDEE